jgi:hypothetical protein
MLKACCKISPVRAASSHLTRAEPDDGDPRRYEQCSRHGRHVEPTIVRWIHW